MDFCFGDGARVSLRFFLVGDTSGDCSKVGKEFVFLVLSVSQERTPSISYQPLPSSSFCSAAFFILNAFGIIEFAFRGHNLALEIQATMASIFKHLAHVPMWRGAKVAYLLIAMCLFPIAIGSFWAYGNLVTLKQVIQAEQIDPARFGFDLASEYFMASSRSSLE
ncbi:hypothetical protein ZIOFF_044214 [Zingiber officinale]|uniref:Amino acid transporter transmembrane domain-containing protein n=1 Tax=Zingiber officinale TaxID=94328 RepID=A0A8J5FWC8_ZINOF|nr:hypothetical protein ZIOFF_044214 [Zingiber officinale]